MLLLAGCGGAEETQASAIDDANPDTDTHTVRGAVLGIHGLLNKPPAETLETWWRESLDEGLRRNVDATPDYPFTLAYWADVRHAAPIALEDLDQPYVPAAGAGPLPAYEGGPLHQARAFVSKWGGAALDKEKDLIGLGRNVESMIGVGFDDLDEYYQNADTRRRMRDRLQKLLLEHRDDRILLVAHSMGSIIAYDVLRELESDPSFSVAHLVTIGSPLGLPIVARKVREEFGGTTTPRGVLRWTNVSDPGDKVALDCELADEYEPSADGVAVTDVFIVNGYVTEAGEANNHKSYGYLRAPELTALLVEFIGTD
jgi:hypothetical protein